jgi:hypothetical protein
MNKSTSPNKPATVEDNSTQSIVRGKLFTFRIKRLLSDGLFVEASDVEEAKKKVMNSLINEIRVTTENPRNTKLIMKRTQTRADRAEMRSRRDPSVRAARLALWTAMEEREYRDYIAGGENDKPKKTTVREEDKTK